MKRQTNKMKLLQSTTHGKPLMTFKAATNKKQENLIRDTLEKRTSEHKTLRCKQNIPYSMSNIMNSQYHVREEQI